MVFHLLFPSTIISAFSVRVFLPIPQSTEPPYLTHDNVTVSFQMSGNGNPHAQCRSGTNHFICEIEDNWIASIQNASKK